MLLPSADHAEHIKIALESLLGGATFIGFLNHMFETMPPIKNPWIKWPIGGIQWLIGRRMQAQQMTAGIGSDQGKAAGA